MELSMVLLNVTADMSPTGDLHVPATFLWGDVALSLLRRSYVLPRPGTLPGGAHPTTLGSTIHRRLFDRHDAMPIHMAMVSETVSLGRPSSGADITFELSISSLQAASSFACCVALPDLLSARSS